MGIGGGAMDAGYLRGVITGSLGQFSKPGDLAAARNDPADSDVRDYLTVALGLAGDKAVLQDVTRILREHPDGSLRQEAAMALATLHDPQSAPALRGALLDRYTRVTTGGGSGQRQPPAKIYPVREQAAAALGLFGEKVDETVWRQPRSPENAAELVSYLFEDKVPAVCDDAVSLLGGLGEAGRPYLEAFVKENEANENLADSVKAAQEILAKAPQPGK